MSTNGRRISYVLLVGLCCWLLLASGAPIDETESNGLDSAIEDIGRAKRNLRKKSSKGARSLVRYRYPIQSKRSFAGDDDEEEEEEDDIVEMLVNRLAGQEESIDLNDLAKEVALELLLEGNQNGYQQQHHPAIMKKKKKKSGSLEDEKRKKRMNSLMERFMGDKGELDNEDEEDGDDDEEDPVQDLVRELINQGLSEEEIETLVSALAEKEAAGAMGEEEEEEEDDDKKKKKKKRSPEWRKLPRGAHRWRYLHSDSSETPRSHHNEEADDAEHQDPSSRPSYVGRGFHRVGSGGQDDPISRSVSQLVSAKRIHHPLMTKNAVSAISKRSAASAPEENIKEDISQQHDDSSHIRKRRSILKDSEENNKPANVSSDKDDSKSAEDPQPADNKEAQTSEEHKGVIRKKSVDWDDYFGFDKRSPGHPQSDDAAATKQYYKTVADSLAYRRKRNGALVNRGERDAEEALEAAFVAAEEERHREGDLERIRSDMLSQLVENLSPEDMDQMTTQLAEELLLAMKEDDDDDMMDNKKRSSLKKKRPVSFRNKRGEWRKKKDQRRKRNSSAKHHTIARRPKGKSIVDNKSVYLTNATSYIHFKRSTQRSILFHIN